MHKFYILNYFFVNLNYLKNAIYKPNMIIFNVITIVSLVIIL